MRRETIFVTLSVCLTIIAASAIIAQGGPLDPPGGPVISTMKTLDEVEPRIAINDVNTPGNLIAVHRILQPGSYYLTADLFGVIGKSGLSIESNDVTVDLNGFTIRGVQDSLSGIVGDTGLKNLSVSNGSIVGWDDGGLDFQNVFGNVRVDSVRATDNLGIGVATGGNAIVTATVAQANTEGFNFGFDCIASECIAIDNAANGFTFPAGHGQAIDCIANFNGGDAISIAFSSVVKGCNVIANGGAGVHALSGDNRIEGNNAIVNQRGYHIEGIDNLVAGNSARGSAMGNYAIDDGNHVGELIVDPGQGFVASAWANFSY